MIWKFSGDRSVYQQIMALIRGAIIRGDYHPGDKLPSVRDLASEARVNPNTMQRALSELEREDILVSHGTIGRFITEDRDVLTAMKEEAQISLARECAEKFRELGLDPQSAAQLLLDAAEKEET